MGPLDFIGPVSDLTRDVLDKIWPSPEDKAKVAQAQAQIQLAVAAAARDETSEFHSFVTSYEGEGDKVSPALQMIRGSVRPVVTYLLVAAFIWGFLHPLDFNAAAMDFIWKLCLLVLSFWFGERSLKNLGLDLSKPPQASPTVRRAEPVVIVAPAPVEPAGR